jgi:hypothetical protein
MKPVLTTKDGRRFSFEISIAGVVVEKHSRVPCKTCGGTGKSGGGWSLEEETDCPNCYGHGSHDNPMNERVLPPKDMVDFVEAAMLEYINKTWPKENEM